MHGKIIRTITKAQLCEVLGLTSSSGRCYYSRLRKEYFTDEALKKLGMPEKRYLAVRNKPFNFFETERICDLFKISHEEIENLEPLPRSSTS